MATTLTDEDLSKIRGIMREEIKVGVFEGPGLERLRTVVRDEVETVFENRGREIVRQEIKPLLKPLENKVDALQNDVIELYGITKKLGAEMRRGFRHVNQRLARLEDNAGLPAMKF
jgi:hypothetical protein